MDAAAQLERLGALFADGMLADRLWAGPRLAAARERLAAGRPIERSLAELDARLSASLELAAQRSVTRLRLEWPDLPVAAAREDITASLRRHPVLVLTGETGSGKTTQLPKMLLDMGYGRRGVIAMTQPRRVAACAIAARLRDELDVAEPVVAHAVRFDDRADPSTLVRVMTDGLLLAEAANDPLFSRCEAVVVDEAHERSLNIDLLLGLLKRARKLRPDLLVVVSSASIEAQRFADFLAEAGVGGGKWEVGGGASTGPGAPPQAADATCLPTSHLPPPTSHPRSAPIVAVSGRTHPVEIVYQPPADDDVGYLDAAIRTVRDLHAADGRRADAGDVLVFLPTERDILEARRRLDDLPGASILPLFSRLTPAEQQRVFAPAAGRKVVLATNIAETSLTIPGIVAVVDTGLARIKRYQPSTRTERLPIAPISQASATQRAGRAGRVRPGVCIRLYAEDDLARREPYTTPEILRSNLAGVLLSCLHMGVDDPQQFPWLDAPSPHAWDQAWALLDELGAVGVDRAGEEGEGRGEGDSQAPIHARCSARDASSLLPPSPSPRAAPRRGLTPLGRTLARIPADPQVARILVGGLTEGCAHEAATVAAFLSVQDPRVRPLGKEGSADTAHRSFAHEAGDIATVLRLWRRWQEADSNSRRARLCDGLYLGYRRMREWADVRHQLWQSLRECYRDHPGLRGDGHAGEDWPITGLHRAVLAGMLGNVLMWEPKTRSYRGAGDRQMWVHPGSALRAGKEDDGRKAPPPAPWLVACEVVETSRLFARLCAPIEPQWVVELAGERVRRRHRDPHYDPQRRQAVVVETITWKGLPVRDGRLVPLERIDPIQAQQVFIAGGLVREEGVESLADRFPALARNRELLVLARGLRERLRDGSILVEEEHLVAVYGPRLAGGIDGQPVASANALAAWCAARGGDPLAIGLAELVEPEAAARAEGGAPTHLSLGGRRLPLTYRFSPGDADDGATLDCREEDLALLDPVALDWLVPLWLDEVCLGYLQQVPKDDRRRLVPLAASARAIADELRAAGSGDLDRLLPERLRARGIPAPPLDRGALPAWTQIRVRVRDAQGAVVHDSRDRGLLLRQGAASGDRLRLLRAEWETRPGSIWPGDCPGEAVIYGVRGWVALIRDRDAQGRVAARRGVHAHAAAAEAWHEDGLEALLEAALHDELEALVAAPAPALAARAERAFGVRVGVLRRQLALAAAIDEVRGRVRDAAAWEDLLPRARTALVAAGRAADALIGEVQQRADDLRSRLRQGSKTLAAAGQQRALLEAVDRLAGRGWAARLPWTQAQRIPAYLDAVRRRHDLAQRSPAEAERLAQRGVSLLNAWQDAIDPGDQRWHRALGLARRVVEAAGLLEDCLLACATAGSHAANQAEGRLRARLNEVSAAVTVAKDRMATVRARLLEARPLLGRVADAGRRDRLAADLDGLIARIPDLTVGADPDLQAEQAEAVIERVRASV